MLPRFATCSLPGIEARPVNVEVDIFSGAVPKTTPVGLAEVAVIEGIDRLPVSMPSEAVGMLIGQMPAEAELESRDSARQY